MATLKERLQQLEAGLSKTPLSAFFADKSNVPKLEIPVTEEFVKGQTLKQRAFEAARTKTPIEKIGGLTSALYQYPARELVSFALDIGKKDVLPKPKSRLGLTLQERLLGLGIAENEELESAFKKITRRAGGVSKFLGTEQLGPAAQLPAFGIAALGVGGEVFLDTYLGGGKGQAAKRLAEEAISKIGREETERLLKSGGQKLVKSELNKISRNRIGVSVLQIVDNKTGQVEFKAIPKEQFGTFKRLIDSTDKGVAGIPINNKIYHLTAKSPRAMTATGARYRGVADIKEIENIIGKDSVNIMRKVSKRMADDVAPRVQTDTMFSLSDSTIKGDTAVNKIIEALGEARPLRKQQETILRRERGKKLAGALAVREKVKGEAGFFAEKAQLRGEAPRVEFETLRGKLTKEDIDSLFTKVVDSPIISDWDKFTAREGLAKLLGEAGGRVPTKSEITLLNKVFGEDFTKAILKKRTIWEKLANATFQLLNIPRSVMASFDLSAPFRQGIFLIGKPKRFAQSFVKMFRNFGSERAFKALMSEIDARPTRQLMSDSGLALTDIGYDLTTREEAFMSNWAEQIPLVGRGIRASERAYVGFLNKLRADVFDDLIVKADNLGLDATENLDLSRQIAKFINAATGRGGLGKLERAAVPLNTVFFSPRLMASRLTLLNPIYYLQQNKFVRNEALKSLFAFASIASSVIGLLSLNKNVTVEKDPRSADFAKVKIGNTRLDMLGGFQQYIRTAAQLISGRIVSSTTGKTMILGEGYRPLTRYEILLRTLEYKTAPVASFVLGLLKGQSAIGEDFEIAEQTKNRFIPMVAQDVMDLQKDSPDLLPLSVLAAFGFGLQTYAERTLDDIKKDIKEDFDKGKITREAAEIKYKEEVKKFERREKTLRFEMPEDEYKEHLKNLYQEGAMTRQEAEEEYEQYKEKQILKNSEQRKILDKLEKEQPEKTFIDSISLYAKAIGTDPITAFNRIFTGQRIRRLDSGAIIVERMPFEESQAIKSELGAVSGLILDHTIPLQLGGSNSKNNLKLVPKETWEEYTDVENYLGRLLRNGKITKEKAQQLIKDYKNGKVSEEEIIKNQ